jgi:hypothetical protein
MVHDRSISKGSKRIIDTSQLHLCYFVAHADTGTASRVHAANLSQQWQLTLEHLQEVSLACHPIMRIFVMLSSICAR